MVVSPSELPEPPKRRIVGRYALYGEIASGGMASVHFGQLLGPVGFSRTVAIKKLHPQFARDPEFVSMFLDEARLAARIRHPNVIPTLDVVAEADELFLVMEYVQGEALYKLLRAKGSDIPVPVALAIASNVLQGLHAAHETTDEQGQPLHIVHRDVSPQNIMVGVEGTARVLDFGIAKAVGRLQQTKDGSLKGKLRYVSPEQLSLDANLSRRSDIYSASVVLWEMLTGKRIFDGESEGRICMMVLQGEVLSPRALVPTVSEQLSGTVMRGMSRRAEDRFETAREMAHAIEACGRVATPIEVSEWLTTVAGARLQERAKNLASIEQVSVPEGSAHRHAYLGAIKKGWSSEDESASELRPPATVSSPGVAAKAGRKALPLVALSVLLLALLVAAGTLVMGRERPDSKEGGGLRVAASETSPVLAVAPPAPREEPIEDAAASAASSPVSIPAVASVVPTGARTSAGPVRTAPGPGPGKVKPKGNDGLFDRD